MLKKIINFIKNYWKRATIMLLFIAVGVLLATNTYKAGFEFGKIGPKDGADYIGGNYATALNFATTLPGIFKDLESIDFSFFIDSGNVWGVDYSDSISDNSKIRTSTGLAVDWLTPIGPLSFSFAKALTKADTDKTETFRFDIGTTF